MRRVRTNLAAPGYSILIAAGFNVFLLICFIIWAPVHSLPRYGLSFYSWESHHEMESYQRDTLHFVTISSGESPRVYADGIQMDGGLAELPTRLAEWKQLPGTAKKKMTILLECDPAVTSGLQNQICDLIMLHGFECSIVGRPSIADER